MILSSGDKGLGVGPAELGMLWRVGLPVESWGEWPLFVRFYYFPSQDTVTHRKGWGMP